MSVCHTALVLALTFLISDIPYEECNQHVSLENTLVHIVHTFHCKKQYFVPEFPDDVNPVTKEKGGPRGPEPTRYGDWERKGRCVDFFVMS